MTSLSPRSRVLIEADETVPADALFVEARFHSPDGEWSPAIPGAVLATLDNGVLAGRPRPDAGRFPLPDPDTLADTLSRWGADPERPVVVYAVDPDDAKTAARGWFVFRNAGLRDVRVLDGGAAAWSAARRAPAPAGTPAAVPADVTPIDTAQAAEFGRTATLLDARPHRAFAEGHIPGATSAPGGEVFDDGRLLPPERLVQWAASVGVRGGAPVAAYCGGGVAAAGTVFALAALGITAPLYVGSWSHWSRQGLPSEA